MSNTPPILKASGIKKIYNQGEEPLEILKGLDLDIYQGEALCIVGASGAGKSTLLHILGTLDRPSLGRVFFRGEDLFKKSDDELAAFRNKKMGFVFQFHHLISEFNAIENVMLPALIGGVDKRRAREMAEELINTMGLSHRKSHFPSQLSGGEQQRVAIARALIQRPQVLLADEPTGNLDTENERMIQELFFKLKDKLGLTLVVITHDADFARRFPRVKTIKDGRWVETW